MHQMASDFPQLLALHPNATAGNKSTVIRRIAATDLTYNEFYWQHMHENFPVILTDVSNNWECRKNWITTTNLNADDTNSNINADTAPINFDYLRRRIGDVVVPVADCNANYFNSHAKLDLKFYDFLARWQSKIRGEPNCNQPSSIDILYLKDWHLAAHLPGYEFYNVPKFFASDWLNEQLVTMARDDYRFVYMGPKGTWTPYHADVFGSYSWSTNIFGRKKWLIMPPGEEQKLADRLGNLPFSIDENELNENNVRFFTIIQTENEAVFVPSGWFHQVWNETDTISVNHNWFNACNVLLVWRNLQTNMRAVRAEIADCQQMDNFEAHCQTMLRASFGINYLDFIELLEFIAARRLPTLLDKTTSRILLFNVYQMNEYHIRYDLDRIRSLLTDMIDDETVRQSELELHSRCVRLQQQLNECLDEAG